MPGICITTSCGNLRDTHMGSEHESGHLSQLQWTWVYPKEEGSKAIAYKRSSSSTLCKRTTEMGRCEETQMPGSHSILADMDKETQVFGSWQASHAHHDGHLLFQMG